MVPLQAQGPRGGAQEARIARESPAQGPVQNEWRLTQRAIGAGRAWLEGVKRSGDG